ncbi:MAG: sortase [Acidimicrobiia bacterium]|nr:sortase [Acidimicrobiia bacterium]MDH3396532.1 sortase [Acidimicrobiia bacterium]
MTRTLKATGWIMIGLGVLILVFLGYQLVGTNFLTARSQDLGQQTVEEHFVAAQEEIEVVDTLPPPQVDDKDTPEPLPHEDEPPVVHYGEPTPEDGLAFGVMTIPRIEAEHVLFEGVDRATLKKGPGHMPWTPLPGQPGNAVVSGHRTTYGAPFFDLDQLEPGDEILVETVLGTHTYVVRSSIIVAPTAVEVTDPKRGAWLTLTTCNPKFSARERLIISAELVDGPNFAYALADKEFVPQEAS